MVERFDARNDFSTDVEPLKQNQYGGTAGDPSGKTARSTSATTRDSGTASA